MYEKENKINIKNLCIVFITALLFSLVFALLCRNITHAQELESTEHTTEQITEQTTEVILIATDTDTHNYLTFNSTSEIGLLLSIRNLLVCIWGSLVIGFAFYRFKAIIYRLSGKGGKE